MLRLHSDRNLANNGPHQLQRELPFIQKLEPCADVSDCTSITLNC